MIKQMIHDSSLRFLVTLKFYDSMIKKSLGNKSLPECTKKAPCFLLSMYALCGGGVRVYENYIA